MLQLLNSGAATDLRRAERRGGSSRGEVLGAEIFWERRRGKPLVGRAAGSHQEVRCVRAGNWGRGVPWCGVFFLWETLSLPRGNSAEILRIERTTHVTSGSER
jgi:hypothetical protein